MKILFKNKFVVFISGMFLIILAAILILHSMLKNDLIPENPYPTLPSPFNQCYADTGDVKELAKNADTIFVGKVIEVGEPEIIPYQHEPGTPEYTINEKLGSSQVPEFEFSKITIEIQEKVKGSINKKAIVNSEIVNKSEKEIITIFRKSENIECEPDFNKYKDFVFFTTFNDYHNSYLAIHPQAGYFYITEDSKVFPAAKTASLEKNNGLELEAFLKQLR